MFRGGAFVKWLVCESLNIFTDCLTDCCRLLESVGRWKVRGNRSLGVYPWGLLWFQSEISSLKPMCSKYCPQYNKDQRWGFLEMIGSWWIYFHPWIHNLHGLFGVKYRHVGHDWWKQITGNMPLGTISCPWLLAPQLSCNVPSIFSLPCPYSLISALQPADHKRKPSPNVKTSLLEVFVSGIFITSMKTW